MIFIHWNALATLATHTQTVNVTDSVKFPRHCERASPITTKGQDWSFYFLSSVHQRQLLFSPTQAMTHWRTKACVCLWSYRVTKQKVHNSGESNNVLTLKKGVVKISEEFKGQGKVCKCAVRLKDSFHSKPVWKLLQAHLSGEVIQATHLDEVRTVSRCPCTLSSSLSILTHKGLTPHRINLHSCSATWESNYSVCLQISFSIQNKASGGQIA